MDHPLTLALSEAFETSKAIPESEWAISFLLSTNESWCVRVYDGRYSLECLRSIPIESNMSFESTMAAYVSYSTSEPIRILSAYLVAKHTGYENLQTFDSATANLFYRLNDMRLQTPFILQHKKKVKSP